MRLSSIVLLFVFFGVNNILANSDVVLIDPMLPKQLNIKTNISEKKDLNTDNSNSLFVLNAIGSNEYEIYCVINGTLMTIDDTISDYKVHEINEDSVILINEKEEVKKLTIN